MACKQHHDAGLDFDAQAVLRARLNERRRTRVSGVTIDPPGSRILDDGLSVRRTGDGWRLDVSAADVPALVPEGSDLELYALRRYHEQSHGDERVRYVFPYGFLLNFVSLGANTPRPAITVSMDLSRDFKLRDYRIARTVFTSHSKCDNAGFLDTRGRVGFDPKEWAESGDGLRRARQKNFVDLCEGIFKQRAAPCGYLPDEDLPDAVAGARLVQEATRLTNEVTADFVRRAGAEAPFVPARGCVYASRLTRDFAFDSHCNGLAWHVIDRVTAKMPDYLHITSPMRSYGDFIGMKVVGRILGGRGPDATLTRRSIQLQEAFNSKAGHNNRSYMASPSWIKMWEKLSPTHGPGSSRAVESNKRSWTSMLKKNCYDLGLNRPLIAERTIMIGGVEAVMVVMKCDDKAPRGQSWQVMAFDGSADAAMEKAASQMLTRISVRYPGRVVYPAAVAAPVMAEPPAILMPA